MSNRDDTITRDEHLDTNAKGQINLTQKLLNSELSNQQEKKELTLNEAYEIIGGFKKFQWLIAVMFVTGWNSGGFLFLNLGLLELEPKYLCRDPANPSKGEYSCKSAEICSNPNISYRVD